VFFAASSLLLHPTVIKKEVRAGRTILKMFLIRDFKDITSNNVPEVF